MYKTLDAPLSAHVEIDTNCNQRCRNCYNFWREDQPHLSIKLSGSLALRIANQLHAAGIFHAILTGGEPLIRV